MKSGEICEITISDPQLAFGAEETPSPLPNGPSIPPSAQVCGRERPPPPPMLFTLHNAFLPSQFEPNPQKGWEVDLVYSAHLLTDESLFDEVIGGSNSN